MADIKISVIIPIYNVEKYVVQCVDSVINQSYKNLNIILVDDGSYDNSPCICDEYAIYDKRIKVIHKNNGGLSDARNIGIEYAIGDYIIFLDSDDYWSSNSFLEQAVQQLFEFPSDVINFGYDKLYQESNKIRKIKYRGDRSCVLKNDKDKSFEYLIKNNLFITCAWNKLIKRSLFINNDLFFKKGIFSEDIDWCARLAIYAKSFDIINDEFLMYRQRSGSITRNISEKNIHDLEKAIEYSLEFIPINVTAQFKKSYYSFIALQYSNYLICVANYYSDLFEHTKQFLKKYQYLMKYNYIDRVKYIGILLNAFDIRITLRLIKVALEIRNYCNENLSYFTRGLARWN